MNLLYSGLQRSGTNFLETLLKKKYRVRFLNCNKDRRSVLHKHFRLYDDKEIIPEPQYRNELKIADFENYEQLFDVTPDYYLVISKDPYSWFLSYNKWKKICDWPTVSHHYILEYNLFYGKWLEFSLQTEKILFCRYIDLLQDTEKVLSRLELKMNLRKKILYQFMSSRLNKVSQSDQFTNDRRKYYLSEKYMQEFRKKDLQDINAFLDPKVISLLGYEMRENAE